MSENDKFTTKDLYKALFHCRAFELQHLWQRSIFLAGFMVALFTLYGSFVGDNFIKNESNQITIHYFAFFIGCAGIILSQLFIMMIIGSKRWYEQFEQSIYWFY